jgi:hypothetical protein
MAKRMGLEAKLYYGGAGTTATTLATNVRDLSAPLSDEKADISDRSSPIALYGPGMLDGSLSWESNWSDTDTFVQTLYAAATARTPVALRTKDFAAGKGWDGDFYITKSDVKQPLKEGQKIDFEAFPTDLAGRTPQIYI